MAVGFVGVGKMGSRMALNLLNSGVELNVWNRTPGKTGELSGAVVVDSLVELGNCDFVFLSVSDGKAVSDVLFGNDGLLSSAKKGLVVVDTSTIDPVEAASFSARVGEFEVFYLDAPVLSPPRGLDEKNASFVVSGDEQAFNRALPLIRSCGGGKVIYLGKSGNASYMKIVNNLVHGVLVAGLSEAISLAKKAGLDMNLVKDALDHSSMASSTSIRFTRCCVDNYFPPTFSMDLRLKDSEIAEKCCTRLDVISPMTQASIALYQQAVKSGMAKESPYALVKLYEKSKRKSA